MNVVKIIELEYAAGHLPKILEGFYRRQLDGTVTIEVLAATGISQRVLVLRRGKIVYAGLAIPAPYEFVTELSRYVRIDSLDAILKFAAARNSVHGVVSAMVNVGVLQWHEVAAALQQNTIAILEELYPTVGRIIVDDDPTAFDLDYLGSGRT